MGMDYKYAGSSSYPRFDEEVKSLVKLFGGRETDELKNRKENQTGLDYWFGYMSSADEEMQKYIFKQETNEVLVKWFNNIYDRFNKEDTKMIFNEIQRYKNQVKKISDQIYYELESLYCNNEGWSIS